MPDNVISYPGSSSASYDLYIERGGQYWNGSALAAIVDANWTMYATAGSQQGTTGVFNWTVPASLPPAPKYSFIIRQRAGGSAAKTDVVVGGLKTAWDGTDLGKVVVDGTAAGAISTASFAAGATLPRVTLVDTLTTYTGNTPQTGDAFARLGAPAGVSLAADVAAVKADLTGYNNLITTGTVNDPSPSAGSFIGSSGLSSTNGFYVGQVLCFTSGALKGLRSTITGYAGATRRLTFAAPFPQAPANSVAFDII